MALVMIPPDTSKYLTDQEVLRGWLAKFADAEVRDSVQRLNARYYPWDAFRHRPMPPGVSPEEAWAYIKLIRSANYKTVPFSDKNGKPFHYFIPDHLLKALNEIDIWSGGNILTDQPGTPPREQYVISSLMEEAIASSQLEGAATTRNIAKEMLRSGRKPKNHSEQMIVNNWETIQFIRQNLNGTLTLSYLLEIHRLITHNTLANPSDAGRLRTSDDIIVEYNNETVHVPPKFTELPQRLEAFCSFASDDTKGGWIHPVIKAAMLHFWLAYDHPFVDGNGRTARALLYWYLLSRKYYLFEYLSISRYIIRAPARYVRAYLYTEYDGGDLTYFLSYNLGAICRAIDDFRAYFQRKQDEINKSSTLLRNYKGLNPRQRSLLYHAIRHPHAVYTIETHRNYHQIVYETARRDLLEVAERGFLKKEKEGKEFVFVPNEDLIDKLRKREAIDLERKEEG